MIDWAKLTRILSADKQIDQWQPKPPTVGIVARALGIPNDRIKYDDQIIELAQKLPFSLEDIADLLTQAHRILGLSRAECLAFIGNDPDRVRSLAYCISVTKHWEAANLEQLRRQGLYQDP